MAKTPNHLKDFFAKDDDSDDDRPPLTPEMVQAAEKSLGYRLPASYVELLEVRNGGYLKRNVFPTTQCPGWAEDHVPFDEVMGICSEDGIDSETGSAYLIAEWDYPEVGVVISTEGHTAFMLDYSECGSQGEPRVIWIDTETGTDTPDVVVLAANFKEFLEQLREPAEGDS